MHISLDCIPCIVTSYRRLLAAGMVPVEKHEPGMRRLLSYLAEADYRQSPPVLARDLHRMIRRDLDDPDPYAGLKERSNRMMLDRLPEFTAAVTYSADPFDTAMRLAIAGNAIDFGPENQLDVAEMITRALEQPLAIDDSALLRRDLAAAGKVLYIGDNCGEIVLDRLFLEQITGVERYFAVRGGPIINDATIEDARALKIDEIARVITTGDDAPGAVPEAASDEFREICESADVIIAKGQGNLEGLLDSELNIYFLLITKCDLIARRVGTRRGELVAVSARNLPPAS